MCMTVHDTAEENITTGSKAVVDAKLDGIKLYSGTFDICKDVLPQVNLSCPLSAGQHSITVKTKIPEIAPRVSDQILCHIVWFHILTFS